MYLHRLYSLVPIEILSSDDVTKIYRHLAGVCTDGNIGEIVPFYERVSDTKLRMLHDATFDEGGLYVLFEETSILLCVVWPPERITLDIDFVRSFLGKRSKLHHRLLSERHRPAALSRILALAQGDCAITKNHIAPEYVFSFSIFEVGEVPQTESDMLLFKVLAEPSLVGLDDITVRDVPDSLTTAGINKEVLEEIHDCDISKDCVTYVTWATVIAIVTEGTAAAVELCGLLLSLEVRLQVVWNRCYVTSRFIDASIDIQDTSFDVGAWIINLVRAADDARSMLSSMISSRAQRIFDAMVRTSNVRLEVEKLERKIGLFQQLVDRHRALRQRSYSRVSEILLFVIAAVSSLQVFVPIPLFPVTEDLRLVVCASVLTAAFLIGYFAIWRKPD